MIRRLALAAAALALVAGCSESRALAINYGKSGVDDVQAIKDRDAFRSVSGVNNVIMEHERDGNVRMQVFVEEGKELKVYGKAEELGYTRQ